METQDPQKNQPFKKRLGFAFQGLATAYRQEKSFRTHILLGSVTIAAAFFLKLSNIELAMIILCIALVLAAELCNTAIEYLVDFLHPENSPHVKDIKDVAAGMVLIISLGSALVGGLIFIPALVQFFKTT